jgi:hypothetical protein
MCSFGKKSCVAILVCYLSLFMIDGRVYGGAGDMLKGLVPGAGTWLASGTVKRVITGAFSTGGGMKYIRLGLSPAQIGVLVGTLAAGAGISYLQEKWMDYLGLGGDLQLQGGVLKHFEAGTPTLDSTSMQTLNEQLSSYQGAGYSVFVAVYATQEAAYAAAVHDRDDGFGNAQGYSLGTHTYYSRWNASLLQKDTTAKAVRMYVYPVGSGSYQSNDINHNATSSDISDIVGADVNGEHSEARKTAARALWEDAEEEMDKVLRDKASSQQAADMAAAIAGLKAAIETNMSQATKDALATGDAVDEDVTAKNEADTIKQAIDDALKNQTATNNPAFTGFWSVVAWPAAPSISERFLEFINDLKATSFWSLPSTMTTGFPSGGDPSISFNGGVFGSHTYTFASWGSGLFNVIKGIVLVICSWVGIRIAVKGGGG